MIQAIREAGFTAYIETKASQINTHATSTQIRHLMKFTNDLDGAVFYAYASTENIYDRYTSLRFQYNIAPNVYSGKLNLIPAGYFKYEVYEVTWIGAVVVGLGTAPKNENEVLPVFPSNGVVEGLVAIGKLYLAEKAGSEEVQYTEYEATASTNTIYYGQ